VEEDARLTGRYSPTRNGSNNSPTRNGSNGAQRPRGREVDHQFDHQFDHQERPGARLGGRAPEARFAELQVLLLPLVVSCFHA